MKRFFTLLLVLAGFVCTANATKKRIYLKAENGWTDVDIHLYKGSDNITGAWPGLNLERIGSTAWFYGDVDSDITDAKCIVSSNGYDQTPAADIDLSTNNAIYLYNSGGNKISVTTFTGYVIANGYTAADNTLVNLTQNGLELTGTLDLSSEGSNTEFRVFPSILSESTYYVGNVAIAPDENLTLSSFEKYQDDISLGDTYKWTETAHQKYDVKINLETGKFTFTPYFERTLPAAAEGYATFSSTYDVIPGAGLTAQYASEVNTTTGKITWVDYPATGIKAGEGALLTGAAGETYKFTPASSAVAPGTNLLKAIPTTQQVSGANNYILSKPSTKVGFFRVASGAGSWCSAGTAYLAVPVANSRDYFWIDDETTGIEAVDVNPETVKAGAREYYNLNGQRVANPSKGLYIVNGKKVIIK